MVVSPRKAFLIVFALGAGFAMALAAAPTTAMASPGSLGSPSHFATDTRADSLLLPVQAASRGRARGHHRGRPVGAASRARPHRPVSHRPARPHQPVGHRPGRPPHARPPYRPRPPIGHRPVRPYPPIYYEPRRRYGAPMGAVIAAGAAGAAVGAAVARSSGGYPAPHTAEWNRLCAQKYNSFRASDGTYLGYDGARHLCRIP